MTVSVKSLLPLQVQAPVRHQVAQALVPAQAQALAQAQVQALAQVQVIQHHQ